MKCHMTIMSVSDKCYGYDVGVFADMGVITLPTLWEMVASSSGVFNVQNQFKISCYPIY